MMLVATKLSKAGPIQQRVNLGEVDVVDFDIAARVTVVPVIQDTGADPMQLEAKIVVASKASRLLPWDG